MSKEKVILSFVAVLVGLFFAGVVFFLYQSTKKVPESETKTEVQVTPDAEEKKTTPSFPLTIDTPKEESVATQKTITVTGKTDPKAIVILSTELDDIAVTPTASGSFTTTAALTDGENQIVVTAIGTDGKETSEMRTVTYSTEEF